MRPRDPGRSAPWERLDLTTLTREESFSRLRSLCPWSCAASRQRVATWACNCDEEAWGQPLLTMSTPSRSPALLHSLGPASHGRNAGRDPPAGSPRRRIPSHQRIPSLGPRASTAGVQRRAVLPAPSPKLPGLLPAPRCVCVTAVPAHLLPSHTFLLLSWASSSWELRVWVWLAVAASLSWASRSLWSSSSCRSWALRSSCACARSPA